MSGLNVFESPNRLHIGGNPLLTFRFGGVPTVAANALCSHPHIRICSENITFELAPGFVDVLCLKLPIERVRLGAIPVDVHDFVGEESC